jgi:hypothetical protein
VKAQAGRDESDKEKNPVNPVNPVQKRPSKNIITKKVKT